MPLVMPCHIIFMCQEMVFGTTKVLQAQSNMNEVPQSLVALEASSKEKAFHRLKYVYATIQSCMTLCNHVQQIEEVLLSHCTTNICADLKLLEKLTVKPRGVNQNVAAVPHNQVGCGSK